MSVVDLTGTPYGIAGASAESLDADLRAISERVHLLRRVGKLTPETLRLYYGEKRFEQVAESNAIEGSPLTAGETELAVMKGVTISGHDPAYSQDARSLYRALERLTELARDPLPTTIVQLDEIHSLLLAGRPGAGMFRTEPVRISGSPHRPKETWAEVMNQMEAWERWSTDNPSAPPVLRSVVLHAWLAHIHPFIDGNGRAARAVGNLELIRAGYPPIIIRKSKDRDRYIDALRESDEGGNLAGLFELVLDRVDDALRDLERAATRAQGYDELTQRVLRAQANRLAVWNAAVDLLAQTARSKIDEMLSAAGGRCDVRRYPDGLSLEDFVSLCDQHPVRNSWCFRLQCSAPGLNPVERLAWAGFRSDDIRSQLPAGAASGPSLFWSIRNTEAYPPWRRAGSLSPGGSELTLIDDRWFVLGRNGQVLPCSPSQAAERIAKEMVDALTTDSTASIS